MATSRSRRPRSSRRHSCRSRWRRRTDKQRIDELCGLLNDALGEVTPYKLAVEDPAQILPIDKNAHFMPKRIYDQMVQNIQRDKNLSSLPFCWKRADGRFVAIS